VSHRARTFIALLFTGKWGFLFIISTSKKKTVNFVSGIGVKDFRFSGFLASKDAVISPRACDCDPAGR
jgi:hypothetical protein